MARQKSKLTSKRSRKRPTKGRSATNLSVTVDRLYRVIVARKKADPAVSHTARLFARGPAKVAQKFGEEAVEAVIEGAHGKKKPLIMESADVVYHLLVMWAARGVKPSDVWKELLRREGRSGIAEKAARKKHA
jgi:phosphoribosyl-ATP pyrophosphohydrolase